MTVTLTEAHLKKLTDEDLRTLALCILNDAVSALNTSIEECGLTDLPDPAPAHRIAEWIREVLTNPDNGYDYYTRERHHYDVNRFLEATRDIGKATTGDDNEFPPSLNATAVRLIFNSVYRNRGTLHRPSAYWLYSVLARDGGGFIPSHETPVGYALKVLCDSDDPRLPALAESYLQSGLQANLRPAINRATRQLARLDDLTELNR